MVAAPPEIPGFEFARGPIGSGGFADVYIYRQLMPTREVAVKVLREAPGPDELAQFQAEANVMAQLSAHPSIVSIYVADQAPDGRAYLVMEFCPGPHIGDRYRTERLDLGDVLDMSIRVASAVETAHRVGILHRDIKPANILTSAFGAPLLTDFGIAAAAGDAAGGYGMSVPWSPPESFEDEPPLDVRSDVYSLAATTYTLLAGRSPFEVVGAANDNATLMHRIERQAPARILRADIPDVLNDLLQRTLAKQIDSRPRSALALAQEFQGIQAQLGLPRTQIDVIDASPEAIGAPPQESDQGTRVRPVQIVVPDAIAAIGTRLRPQLVSQPVADRTSRRASTAAPETMHRSPARAVGPNTSSPVLRTPQAEPEQTDDAVRGSRVGLVIGAIVAVAVVAVVTGALLLGGSGNKESATGPAAPAAPADAIGVGSDTPLPVTWIKVRPGPGVVRFQWHQSDARPQDQFAVRSGPANALVGDGTLPASEGTSNVREASAGQVVCLEVTVVRDGVASEPKQNCGVAE